jgi:hypothetical protein
MSTSRSESHTVGARTVRATTDTLIVDLTDGRTLSVPIEWYPRLLGGTVEERNHWELIGGGEGIHWPYLDEDLSVEGLLAGRRSGEGEKSLARWRERYARGVFAGGDFPGELGDLS